MGTLTKSLRKVMPSVSHTQAAEPYPDGITPTASVIAGWNGTVDGVKALALSLERGKQEEQLALHKEYALPYESLESFCDRMVDTWGSGWMNLLTRK